MSVNAEYTLHEYSVTHFNYREQHIYHIHFSNHECLDESRATISRGTNPKEVTHVLIISNIIHIIYLNMTFMED